MNYSRLIHSLSSLILGAGLLVGGALAASEAQAAISFGIGSSGIDVHYGTPHRGYRNYGHRAYRPGYRRYYNPYRRYHRRYKHYGQYRPYRYRYRHYGR